MQKAEHKEMIKDFVKIAQNPMKKLHYGKAVPLPAKMSTYLKLLGILDLLYRRANGHGVCKG